MHYFKCLILKYVYKSGLYLQKIFKILIAFYAKFNVKHLPKFYLVKCRILSCTKTIQYAFLVYFEVHELLNDFVFSIIFGSFLDQFVKAILELSQYRYQGVI